MEREANRTDEQRGLVWLCIHVEKSNLLRQPTLHIARLFSHFKTNDKLSGHVRCHITIHTPLSTYARDFISAA